MSGKSGKGVAARALAPCAALLLGAPAAAQSVEELSGLSIEELAAVEVTSVSKRAEPLGEAPAAVYVISNDDILRSAATSLPEVLRLAPNLAIQQLDARQYAISARGFNGIETANKMLAMIDGRTIYSTLFSGIFWELHSPLLEDIQQIEVVSGPGGTLFGPNAVNGVISVQTRDAHDTIGALARAAAAANERTAAVRYGAAVGEGAVRVYAHVWDREDRPDGAGPDIDDRFRGIQGGFRADFGSAASSFTVQGDIFHTDVETLPGDGDHGHNVLARWTGQLGTASSLQVQGYYDYYKRRSLLVTDALQTFDVEAQYNARLGRHDIVVGAGLRTTNDRFVNDLNPFRLEPVSKRLWIGNVFAQDEFAVSDRVAVTAGVKFEDSSFSGIEVLPNLRLAWTPGEDTLLWAAVSRAVRTPSRIDRQLQFLPILAPAEDFRSEKLWAIEAGYRGQIGDGTTLSVNIFYNLYDDLRTTEPTPVTLLPIRLANGLNAETWGIEAWSTHQLTPWWRLRFGLSTLNKTLSFDQGGIDLTGGESEGNDPNYRVILRSQMNLTDSLLLDFGLRHVDELSRIPGDDYVEADARLGWRVSEAVELYVAGSNLLHETHGEAGDPEREQLAQRSVLAGTRLRF